MARIDNIREILSVIEYDENMPDKILWSSGPEGVLANDALFFRVRGERRLLLLNGGDESSYYPYKVELYSMTEGPDVDLYGKDGNRWNKYELIYDYMLDVEEFDEDVSESEAKEWAEEWLLDYLRKES